ncbi:MAG: hypothetical protein IKL33_03310 [Alphaproteobacteria bacterium]|nr:hypothetical protein [Alphaproteobacteria bacterium]
MIFIISFVAIVAFLFVSGCMMLFHYKKTISRILAYIVTVVGIYGLVLAVKMVLSAECVALGLFVFLIVGILSAFIAYWVLNDRANKKRL